MKNKTLYLWNVVFYAIQYSASLFYFGYKFGESTYYNRGYIIHPLIHLVFLFIGIHFMEWREYMKSKSYYLLAGTTLLYNAFWLGCYLFLYFDSPENLSDPTFISFVSYSGFELVCAFIIFVLYIVCAVMLKKHDSNKENTDRH